MSLLLAAGSRNRKRSPGTAFLSTTFAESSPGGGTSSRCSTVPVPVPSGELGANVHREGRHWGLRLTRILARSRKITVSHALRTFREGLIRTIVGRPVLTCTIVGRPVFIRKIVGSLFIDEYTELRFMRWYTCTAVPVHVYRSTGTAVQ